MADAPISLGDRIKRLRDAQTPPLSAYELARRAGVTRSTISRLESGEQLTLNTDQAPRLARVLGVTTDQLLGHESVPGIDADEEEGTDSERLGVAAEATEACGLPRSQPGRQSGGPA
jgi:transcriptional regulator with XRE-family HTH domain